MRSTRHPVCLAAAVTVFVLGCGDPSAVDTGTGGDGAGGMGGSPAEPPAAPWPVTDFPELPDVAKDVPESRVWLGNLLFYDPILSVDHETACATCHSEFWGMSDALPVGVGNGAGLLAGPGREGPNTLRRNSQTLFNLVFRETLFWDGASQNLEEQALMPLIAEDELNIAPAQAVTDLLGVPEYVERFEEAFPDDPRITEENLAAALAAFQRTMVSDRAVYDAYVGGDTAAMSEEQVDGMFRFAEMGCDSCHTPPLFESEAFYNRDVPGLDGIIDDGRAEVTGDPDDLRKFRVPTLRNSFDTDPYFHNGSAPKLKDAVRHELEQSGMPFDETDVERITIFIDKTLRDDSRTAIRPRSVPSGLPIPLDGPVFPGR
ncbi:MAG: cytochrome c peroxidase [Myxococcota bacterium]